MLSPKEDKSKVRSSSPLRCCQSTSSLSSGVHEDLEEIKINNNHLQSVQLLEDHKKQAFHYFPKKQAVDVNFEDITYNASSWSFNEFRLRRETKQILHGVSGHFKSGELSVIMGPSGAGKSTLLNILAGFTTKDSGGVVKLNNTLRDHSPKFRKLSAYIPQDEELRLALTPKEAMTFAANLKLGYTVSSEYKKKQVLELLELLGLEECQHTLTRELSGGQKKRLGVALELLSNPPILYLDEPTTGLDSSSCSHCVGLLKRLAQEGRTIVCTIHQPSALLFEMFDKLYALSNGSCIYDGRTKDLVPHLSNYGLRCPPYHNPADFLMEVAIGEYSTDMSVLVDAAKEQQKVIMDTPLSRKEKELLSMNLFQEMHESKVESKCEKSPLPAAVVMQFLLLYKRNLLTAKRCYMYYVNRMVAHIVIGIIFGYLYQGVGSGANTILANYVYLYGTLLLNVYTGKMSVTVSFPLEMKILHQRALQSVVQTYSLLIVCGVHRNTIPIGLHLVLHCDLLLVDEATGGLQAVPFHPLLYTLHSLRASLGYFIGATTPIKVAVFLGPVLACVFSVFGFCLRFLDTPDIFKWLYHVSYYRAGFQGIVYSMYGLNRPRLACPEENLYCHYSDPTNFLREMDIVDVDLVSNISVIVVIWCMMHAATYLTLWLKLNKR